MNKHNPNSPDTLALHLEHLFAQNVNFKDRIITLADEVSTSMFLKLDSALSEMESYNNKTITIRLFSEGGSVEAALAIVGRIRATKCNVVVEAYGYVQSAAVLILASGNKRRMSKYSMVMHHEPSYNVGDSKHSEVRDKWENEEKLEELWCQFMAEFTKKPKKFWKNNGVKKDLWLSPKDLLKLGVIDEIF
jgi:ATP-dependent protease ClpP protease subunit